MLDGFVFQMEPKIGTAVCRTARTVVWEVGKREVGGKHFYQRLPPTRLDILVSNMVQVIRMGN